MAEHVRMVALKAALEALSGLEGTTQPWSLLLPDLAQRVSCLRSRTLDPWQIGRLEELQETLAAPECRSQSHVRLSAQAFAGVALLDAFGSDNLFVAGLAMNLAVSGLKVPLLHLPVGDRPALQLALKYAVRGDASLLTILMARRMTEVCQENKG